MDKRIMAIQELFGVDKSEALRNQEPMIIGEWRYGGGHLYYKLNKLVIEKYKVESRLDAGRIARRHFDGNKIFDLMK